MDALRMENVDCHDDDNDDDHYHDEGIPKWDALMMVGQKGKRLAAIKGRATICTPLVGNEGIPKMATLPLSGPEDLLSMIKKSFLLQIRLIVAFTNIPPMGNI